MPDSLLGLISIGREIEGRECSADELIDQVEDYSTRVEEYLKTMNPAEEPVEELKEIFELHTRIMERASAMLGATSRELKGLKAKRKAIVAYSGSLPKGPTTTRRRRG